MPAKCCEIMWLSPYFNAWNLGGGISRARSNPPFCQATYTCCNTHHTYINLVCQRGKKYAPIEIMSCDAVIIHSSLSICLSVTTHGNDLTSRHLNSKRMWFVFKFWLWKAVWSNSMISKLQFSPLIFRPGNMYVTIATVHINEPNLHI